jgi:hypothetical protein
MNSPTSVMFIWSRAQRLARLPMRGGEKLLVQQLTILGAIYADPYRR